MATYQKVEGEAIKRMCLQQAPSFVGSNTAGQFSLAVFDNGDAYGFLPESKESHSLLIGTVGFLFWQYYFVVKFQFCWF
jgi:hypothetical protein